MVRVLVSGVFVVAAFLCCFGCKQQSNGPAPAIGSTSAAATVAGNPQGPFPRGTVDPSTLPDPATQGPALKVVSPARGALLDAADVVVEVTADDVNGVAEVRIAGQLATEQNGTYQSAVTLVDGVNLIELEATDGLGNVSKGVFTLTHGTFHRDDLMLTNCVAASLSPAGLSRTAQLFDPLLQTLDLSALILTANPLATVIGIEINGTSLTHDALTVGAEGMANGAKVTLEVPNVVLNVSIKVAGTTTTASILADKAVAVAELIHDTTAPAPARPNLPVRVGPVTVTLENFRVQSQAFLTNAVLGLLRGVVQGVVKDELAKLLDNEVSKLLTSTLPGIDTPLEVTLPLPGQATAPRVGALFQLGGLDGDAAAGLGLSLGLQASVVGAPTTGVRRFPVTGQQLLPATNPSDPFTAHISADAVNALLHTAWRAKVLEMTVDGQTLNLASLQLTARLLYPFLPQVKALAPDPATPLQVKLAFGAAPTIGFGRNGQLIELTAGEAEVTIAIDYRDGQPPLDLFTLRIPFTATASVALDPSGRSLEITQLDLPQLSADVIREPAVDLADQEIEDFIIGIYPTLLKEALPLLPVIPLPALPNNLQLQNLRIESSHRDVLTVKGGI